MRNNTSVVGRRRDEGLNFMKEQIWKTNLRTLQSTLIDFSSFKKRLKNLLEEGDVDNREQERRVAFPVIQRPSCSAFH